MASVDVYRITDKLDQNTTEVLATRLESRGKHPRFAAMLCEYLDAMAIDAAERVVDLGCGTGVAGRMIASRPAFSGKVLGIDRSALLAQAANRLAVEEALQNKATFREGDSHRLDLPDGTIDAVVAHTLFSHLDDPRAVMQEIVRVLKRGGKVAIFDGDYASLTFGSDDPARGKADDEMIIDAVVTNARIMRQLPQLLGDAGLAIDAVFPHIIADVGRADFWDPFLTAVMKLLPASGAVSEQRASEWVSAMRRRSDRGIFFGASNYYSYIATKQ